MKGHLLTFDTLSLNVAPKWSHTLLLDEYDLVLCFSVEIWSEILQPVLIEKYGEVMSLEENEQKQKKSGRRRKESEEKKVEQKGLQFYTLSSPQLMQVGVVLSDYSLDDLSHLAEYKRKVVEQLIPCIHHNTKILILTKDYHIAASTFLVLSLTCREIRYHEKDEINLHWKRNELEISSSTYTLFELSNTISTDESSSLPVQSGEQLEATIQWLVMEGLETIDTITSYSENSLLFIRRVIFALIKERKQKKTIQSYQKDVLNQLDLLIQATEVEEHVLSGLNATRKRKHDDLLSDHQMKAGGDETPTISRAVKPLPSVEEGLSVYEFFSGIGGMRLALPKVIEGIPIQQITAFDINHIANKIYEYNFHERKIDSIPHSQLRTCVIESLKPEDVDGKCDIWTMSPPCQPFTTTAGANRKDHLDNRSKGLYHIMSLLLSIKQLPRWIVLENVKGFIGSEMLQLWLKVIRICGYSYQQYLLSPDTALGIPNARRRYYFIAEWNGHAMISEGMSMELFISNEEKKEGISGTPTVVGRKTACMNDNEEESEEMVVAEGNLETVESQEKKDAAFHEYLKAQGIQTELPLPVKQQYAVAMEVPITLEAMFSHRLTTAEISQYHLQSDLFLPKPILETNWAKKYLSLVTLQSRLTYCFTKGYGKLYDHSAGSCLYIQTEQECTVDWENLGTYYQQIRLFHPNELLVLFGFPNDYQLPMVSKKSLLHHYGCIGNSVNVTVVKSVMHCLFSLNKIA